MQRAVVVLVRRDVEVGRWPLHTDERLDVSDMDRIARTQLAAQRVGCTIRLTDACPHLVELLDLTGLVVEVER